MDNCRNQLASMSAEELAENRDYKFAIKLLTQEIRSKPNNHDLFLERSICHHKVGDFQSSLEDADAAIRLNPNHYNTHYQRALALTGLSMRTEAVTSFKKAIELRARQVDSKLSDIFNLLRDAIKELASARERVGAMNDGASGSSSARTNKNTTTATLASNGQGTSNTNPVDSTTDRPTKMHRESPKPDNKNISMDASSNLVATNCNNTSVNQSVSNSGHIYTNRLNRVTSSAHHQNSHMLNRNSLPSEMPSASVEIKSNHYDQSAERLQQQQAIYDWNIRRSERIFLHHSSESGSPGLQYNIPIKQNGSEHSSGLVQHHNLPKAGSNPSSVTSGRSSMKRPHDNSDTVNPFHPIRATKEGTNSHAGSDIDVDDSSNAQRLPYTTATTSYTDQSQAQKRVVIAPSSSTPATNLGSSAPVNRDDSYSSKYKRLRRDRERARRGTSKLCTIKASDLEELYKSSLNLGSTKRHMRVIAPIDGWLYSGQLSIDDNRTESGAMQYAVKLDGDTTGSSYLFNQETVLNDVIKEVKVKSVSELRKGARICCYWSRQYKCLSTGVVTSRTFEATKSLVSVKYDNGDLSALPLEDLRLLPPDYPKYMSNCDPLLLARNGDIPHIATITPSNQAVSQNNGPTFTMDSKSNMPDLVDQDNIGSEEQAVHNVESNDQPSVSKEPDYEQKPEITSAHCEMKAENNNQDKEKETGHRIIIDRDNIPDTGDIIKFITSNEPLRPQDLDPNDSGVCADRDVSVAKDKLMSTSETHLGPNNSRASSEENNYKTEFRPWMFDGPPKRNKRHGRTYRDNYSIIRRGNEVIKVGDSAELMPRDESILPFIAKIDGFWATGRGEMRVRVRWYYRLVETEGEPCELKDGQNALFETDHFDENDVQSIYRSTKILPWAEYSKEHLGHVNKLDGSSPKLFYLAGYYDPVRRTKHLRSDVKEAQ